MEIGVIPESDKGIPQANAPVSVAPLNADLSGKERLFKRNFTISKNQFIDPEPFMASNSGSVRQ
jgi:hypothetical protein